MTDEQALAIANTLYPELELVGALLSMANRQTDAAINDPDAFTPKSLYSSVITAHRYYTHIQAEVEALIDLTRRMIDQRESAKEAYAQGWEARIRDLYDKLDSDEYADLRDALDEIGKGKR